MTALRTLCIVPKNPLPADNGGRQRMVALLDAWRSAGPIDIVVTSPLARVDIDRLAARFDARVHAVAPMRRQRAGRLRWLKYRRLPRSLALVDASRARIEVRRFMAEAPEPHDVVWCSGAGVFWLFGKLRRDVPVVLDFADVTWVLHDRALHVAEEAPDRWHPRQLMRNALIRMDRARATRFERVQAEMAHLVTVCSAADREALGVPGSIVVPNGFTLAAAPVGRVTPAQPPVLVFQGQMTYPPNVDAARWFVREVLPRVRARVPGTSLEIAGEAAPAVIALGREPGVSVLGYVEDLEPVLARADAVVVPLRQGSGTRVKLIEAFAHRIPAVSTTVGAEGLGMQDGVELLVADDPERFADAVVRVVTDDALRARLVERAAERHARELDWQRITADFLAEVRQVMAIAERYEPQGPT